MDFIIDFISDYFYIILVIGSLIANSAFFGKKKDKDGVELSEEEMERERRAREIREEIKRKIANAQKPQQQKGQKPSYDPFSPERTPPAREISQPTILKKASQEKTYSLKKEVQAPTPPLPKTAQYKAQVDQKMEEIRKINERAKSILAQNKTKKVASTSSQEKVQSAEKLPTQIAAFSKNPSLARQALIYHEIFSKPVALREESSF